MRKLKTLLLILALAIPALSQTNIRAGTVTADTVNTGNLSITGTFTYTGTGAPFVDLTNPQTVGGAKTFTGRFTVQTATSNGIYLKPTGDVDGFTLTPSADGQTTTGYAITNAANNAFTFRVKKNGDMLVPTVNGNVYSSQYASLNSAVSAVTAGHAVWINQNTTLTSGITIPTGVSLLCAPGVTITKGFNGDLITMGNDTAIVGCKLDGAKASFTGKVIYTPTGLSNVEASRNYILNSGDAGITSYGSSNVVYAFNRIASSTLGGITIHQGGARIFVTNNYIDCTGGTTDQSDCIGIYSETGQPGPGNVTVSGNVMDSGASDFCVEVGQFGGTTPPSNITITGNVCSANASTTHGGYSIGGATFVTVTGNTYAGQTFTNDIAAYEVAAGNTNVIVSGNSGECYGPCVSISTGANNQDITVSNNEFRVLVNSSTAIKISNSTASTSLNNLLISGNSVLLNGTSDGIFAQCNSTSGNCADWIIRGNHINGSNTASNTGINVTQDAGTMQRIDVMDNDVHNLSVGYKWNAATVSRHTGNTSDNVTTHFSAATAPGATFTIDDVGGITFAQLGSFNNGSRTYCSNCTIANPCATGGTGAVAKRLNGVWVCN